MEDKLLSRAFEVTHHAYNRLYSWWHKEVPKHIPVRTEEDKKEEQYKPLNEARLTT